MNNGLTLRDVRSLVDRIACLQRGDWSVGSIAQRMLIIDHVPTPESFLGMVTIDTAGACVLISEDIKTVTHQYSIAQAYAAATAMAYAKAVDLPIARLIGQQRSNHDDAAIWFLAVLLLISRDDIASLERGQRRAAEVVSQRDTWSGLLCHRYHAEYVVDLLDENPTEAAIEMAELHRNILSAVRPRPGRRDASRRAAERRRHLADAGLLGPT